VTGNVRVKVTGNVRVKVTLRRVRVSNVAVEKQCVLHFGRVCFCSLNYPTRQAHAPCYVKTCGLSGSTIYLHVIGQTTRLSGKKVMNIQRVFSFSVQILSETFLV